MRRKIHHRTHVNEADVVIPDKIECRCPVTQHLVDKLLDYARAIDAQNKKERSDNPDKFRFNSDDFFLLPGVVYAIHNKKNGKYYIGQTMKTFAVRYGGSARWIDYTHNKALLQDVKKYGGLAFDAFILAHSNDCKELDRLELHYADKYNAYMPNGYNYKLCGTNDIEELSRLSNIALVPPGQISGPDGRIYNVTDWTKFCNQHNLEKYSIWKVITGRAAFHYGWTLPGVEKKEHINDKHYTLYDKSGKRYDIFGLSSFCRQRGLKKPGIQSLVLGRNRVSQGFARHPDDFYKDVKRYHLILEKDGREVLVTSAKKQAKSLNLHPRYIYELARGDALEHRGWRLKSKQIVSLRSF